MGSYFQLACIVFAILLAIFVFGLVISAEITHWRDDSPTKGWWDV